MKLGTPATWHDYVEKHAHACLYTWPVTMGYFLSSAPQAGHRGWAWTCCGCLAFMHLGRGVIAQLPPVRHLDTLWEKGPCHDWQILTKSPSSGILPLFQRDSCLQGHIWFQSSYLQELMLFSSDSVAQTCCHFAGISAEAAAATCWGSIGFPCCWCGTAHWVSLCVAACLYPQAKRPHGKGRAAGQCPYQTLEHLVCTAEGDVCMHHSKL